MGNKAVFTIGSSSGYWMKVYRSSERDCKDCPFRKECIGEKTKFKKIDDSIHNAPIRPDAPASANCQFGGMRRIWTRGIEAARKFMLGAAIAYNLKKWLNYKPRKAKVAAKAGELPQDARNNVQNKLILPLFCPHSL